MAWNSNSPNDSEKINATASQIRENFITLDDLFVIDHIPFNANNSGYHSKITFTNNAQSPDFQNNELGLYNATSALTGKNELIKVVNSDENDVTFSFEITSAKLTIPAWGFTDSGMLWKTGSFASNVTGSRYTVTYLKSATIPVFKKVINVFVGITRDNSGADPDALITLESFNTESFKCRVSKRSAPSTILGANATIFYLTMGI